MTGVTINRKASPPASEKKWLLMVPRIGRKALSGSGLPKSPYWILKTMTIAYPHRISAVCQAVVHHVRVVSLLVSRSILNSQTRLVSTVTISAISITRFKAWCFS